MTSDKETLTKKELVEFRKQFNLSQKQFAAIIGVTPQAVELWETGARGVSTTITRVVKIFRKYPQLMQEFANA